MTIRRVEPYREYDGFAGLEGRLRMKLELGEPLDRAERVYLANLRGAREIKPDDVDTLPKIRHQ